MIRPNGSPARFHILAVIQPGQSHDGLLQEAQTDQSWPGRPAPCRDYPSVLGVIPRLAIIGIRIGAIICIRTRQCSKHGDQQGRCAHGN